MPTRGDIVIADPNNVWGKLSLGAAYSQMFVNSAGTGAEWSNRVRNSMASAYLNADQTPTEGTWVKVTMAHESFDNGGNYDVSNYRYVAPVTGFYQCDWGILCSSATNQIDIASSALYVNGAYYRQGAQTRHVSGLQGTIGSNGSCLAYVSAGQYIELYGYCSSGDASAVKFMGVAASAIACYMTIWLVST